MEEDASIHALAQLKMHCETFAKQMLFNSYEFYPFGAFVTPSLELQALAAGTGDSNPASQDLYQLLHNSVASLKKDGKLIAYAIAANVTIPKELSPPYPDGIRLHIEALGYSRFLYTPYRVLPFPALLKFLAVVPVVRYADTIAEDIRPVVFSDESNG